MSRSVFCTFQIIKFWFQKIDSIEKSCKMILPVYRFQFYRQPWCSCLGWRPNTCKLLRKFWGRVSPMEGRLTPECNRKANFYPCLDPICEPSPIAHCSAHWWWLQANNFYATASTFRLAHEATPKTNSDTLAIAHKCRRSDVAGALEAPSATNSFATGRETLMDYRDTCETLSNNLMCNNPPHPFPFHDARAEPQLAICVYTCDKTRKRWNFANGILAIGKNCKENHMQKRNNKRRLRAWKYSCRRRVDWEKTALCIQKELTWTLKFECLFPKILLAFFLHSSSLHKKSYSLNEL